MELETTEYIIQICVFSPKGRIDAFNTPYLRAQSDERLKAGFKNFIVDLSNVTFLDSAAMAALVSLLKSSRQKGGDVKLVWPKLEAAKRILKLTKFDRVFQMLDSVKDGVPASAEARNIDLE